MNADASSRLRGVRRAIALLALGAILSACATQPGSAPGPSPLDPSTVLPTSAARLPASDIDTAFEAGWAELGRRAAADDPVAAVRVAAVLARLVAAAPIAGRTAEATSVDVRILDDGAIDAWCLSLGRCALTLGMLDFVGADDAMLAAVLAHEIAHGLLGHPGERLALAGGEPAPAVLLGRPHHAVHEHEVMGLSLELLARAGFEPRAAIALWSALEPGGASPAATRAAPASRGTAYWRRHPQAPDWASRMLRQARRHAPRDESAGEGARGIIEGSAKP